MFLFTVHHLSWQYISLLFLKWWRENFCCKGHPQDWARRFMYWWHFIDCFLSWAQKAEAAVEIGLLVSTLCSWTDETLKHDIAALLNCGLIFWWPTLTSCCHYVVLQFNPSQQPGTTQKCSLPQKWNQGELEEQKVGNLWIKIHTVK